MKLFCPDCGAAIPADDANLDTALARCRDCDEVFSFRDAVESEGPRRRERRHAPREAVPRPPRFKVEDRGTSWVVRWRWLSAGHFFLLFFCIAWDGFLVFWYSMAFAADAPWIMVVFPIAHVAVGVGLTYTVLTGLLNRTEIELSRGELSIRHGPLPWRGNRTLARNQIDQIYCQESGWRQNNKPGYSLCAMLKDGTSVKLASGFYGIDELRYLEAEIERKLNLVDRPVTGEVARD